MRATLKGVDVLPLSPTILDVRSEPSRMNTSQEPPSHARDLILLIIHDSPDAAAALVRLWVLTDNSTPKGAALRTDAMRFAYSFTDDCREAMERFIAA